MYIYNIYYFSLYFTFIFLLNILININNINIYICNILLNAFFISLNTIKMLCFCHV